MSGIDHRLIAGRLAHEPDGALNWDAVLDHLLAAAEQGDHNAGEQLIILARAPGHVANPADGGAWRELRSRVDPSHWTRIDPGRALSSVVPILVHDRLFDRATCDWLIAKAANRTRRALVGGRASGMPTAHLSRTNTSFTFEDDERDVVLAMAQHRLAAVAGAPKGCCERPQILHYSVGQRFLRHFDFLDPVAPALARQINENGQRIATILLYLNSDYAGGETEFAMLGLRYKGKAGDALLFRNVLDDGTPDRRTLHAGRAPADGGKWLLTQFIRDREVSQAPPAALTSTRQDGGS